jgi:hypothetical protein
VPEVIYDPSLISSPHNILLSFINDDQAFGARNFRSERLHELYIPPGQNQLPLLLDPKFDNMPVFRQAIRTPEGWALHETEPMSYSTLYHSLTTIGKIVNFKQLARPYALRYAGGKAFNESGMFYARN